MSLKNLIVKNNYAEDENFVYYVSKNKCVLIKNKNKAAKNLIIPDFVTMIGNYAFANSNAL